MDDHQPDMRALRREWWAARIIGTLGALLLIAVLGIYAVMKMSDGGAPPAAPPAAAPSPAWTVRSSASRRTASGR